MTTTQEIMPEQHKLLLSFKDKRLESEFRRSYDRSVRIPLRYGMVVSILSWMSSIGLIYVVIPEDFYWLSLLTIAVILPSFGFAVYATFYDRFKGFYHFIGACSNAWAGLYAIYICDQFPSGAYLTLPVLIFIIFFGSYMVRLRWIAGFLAAFSYTLGYHVYIANYSDLTTSQVILFAFVGWLTLIFAIIAGRMAEHNNRIAYVQRRTIRSQSEIIRQEKEASEKLLQNILPPFIASRLKEDAGVIADNHNDASVLFADIVGFTSLSTKLPANELVSVLNKIFSHFDVLTEKHELEKIKTIGDGYMVAGGLIRNKADHVERMANLALEMIDFIENDAEVKDFNLKIRIGINSGAVVAGVIGLKKFTYDLWGDTVNLASRIESQGATGKIAVSEVVKERLERNFAFEKRELLDIKGGGETQTYFLTDQVSE